MLLLKIVLYFLHSILFYRLSFFASSFLLVFKSFTEFSFCTIFPCHGSGDQSRWSANMNQLLNSDGSVNINFIFLLGRLKVYFKHTGKKIICINFFLGIFFYSQLFHFRFRSGTQKTKYCLAFVENRDSHIWNLNTNCIRGEKNSVVDFKFFTESKRNFLRIKWQIC